MYLCIDIGNTFEKLSVYDGEMLRYYFKTEILEVAKIEEVVNQYKVTRAILSSSKIISQEVKAYFDQEMDYIILDHHTPIPIANAYETPETLGRDRLAAAVGAWSIYRGGTSIIVNAGTCITTDVISSKGVYEGGNITPGVWMRSKAMNHFTDKLPEVKLEYKEDPIGKSTIHALQNGAVRGAIWEIESFIDVIRAQYEKPNIILTGGDTNIFADNLKYEIFAHPDLVFIGLNEILKFNA